MCREIEWALATPNARLIITAPPGSAKSRYATQIAPASWLARPQPLGMGNVLLGTHSASIAEEFGSKTRRIVAEHGKSLLGYGLSSDTAAKARWNTTTNREYYALGVGVGISGIRAGLGILDDLYPSRREAESALFRDRVFAWLMDDFFHRLTPGAPLIAVNTRWHEDDHVARLEEVWRKAGTPFKIVNIRAEAEADDPLKRPLGQLLGEDWQGWDYPSRIRQAKAEMLAGMRAREYQALFQQHPTAEEGDFFKREWIKLRDDAPNYRAMRVFGASDYAVTDQGGDYTVHIICGVDEAGELWLLDMWRGQSTPDVWVERWCDLVLLWRPMEWAEETGQIRGSVGPFRLRRAIERGAMTVLRSFPTRGDKAIRAQSIRGRMASRGLHVRADAPWLAELVHELAAFPAGKHDDQVDALGLLGQLLDHMAAAMPEPKPKPPVVGIETWTANDILHSVQPRQDSYL
jgi:predicted phage terminase large subunit-like protein